MGQSKWVIAIKIKIYLGKHPPPPNLFNRPNNRYSIGNTLVTT